MSENKMNGVAMTSLLVAAMRAAETKRSDAEGRLFSDPFAETLAGNAGLELMQKAIAIVGENPAIAVRTAYIDEKYNKALTEGVRQVVIIAAGMDARAFRLTFPSGTKVFELDQPEVLKYKDEKLFGIKPKCERTTLPVDLREEWQNKLLEAGFKRGEKTLWSVEGLLMYLDESQVVTLFEKINTLASANDIVLFDIFNRIFLDSPFLAENLKFLADLGAPWKFGTNEPEEFMKNLGWSANLTIPAEFAPARWPFPVAPKHVPNIPRSYFVEARKI